LANGRGSAVVAAGLALLAWGGCGRPGGPGSGGGPASDSLLADAPSAAAAAGASFLESGVLTTQSQDGGDATQVASLIAAPMSPAAGNPAGERFLIGFARADGFPASTLSRVRVEFLRDLRVIRVYLPPDVVSTAITENRFTGDYTSAAYVVRSLHDAQLYVDLHLRSPAVARATVQTAPALVVVELRGGGPMMPPAPLEGANVVVLTPPREGRVSYPLEITGYGRTFEANVVAQLKREGRLLGSARANAADYASAWGEFRMRIDDGPKGTMQLFVGEFSAEDGAPRGVTTDLHVE
jgi:hypothetical protein